MLEREIARLRELYHQQKQQQMSQHELTEHPITTHRRTHSRDLDNHFSDLSLKHRESNPRQDPVLSTLFSSHGSASRATWKSGVLHLLDILFGIQLMLDTEVIGFYSLFLLVALIFFVLVVPCRPLMSDTSVGLFYHVFSRMPNWRGWEGNACREARRTDCQRSQTRWQRSSQKYLRLKEKEQWNEKDFGWKFPPPIAVV